MGLIEIERTKERTVEKDIHTNQLVRYRGQGHLVVLVDYLAFVHLKF